MSPGPISGSVLAGALVLAFTGAVACSKSDPEPARAPAAQRTRRPPPPPLTLLPPLPPAPVPAGPAFVVIEDAGVVRVEGGRAELVAPVKWARHAAVARDGTLWVVGLYGVMRVDRGRTPGPVVGGVLDRVAVAPNGHVWAVGRSGVMRFDGRRWSTEPAESIRAGEPPRDVAVDASGRVYIASEHRLHVRAGSTFVPVKIPEPSPYTFRELVATGKGVYALHEHGLLRLDGVEVTPVPLDAGARKLSRAGGFGDTLHLAAGNEILRLEPKRSVQRFTAEQAGFEVYSFEAVAVDASWRTWLATDDGLVVVDAQGKSTKWVSGALAEAVGRVRHVVVVGRGPALPPVGRPPTATVQGKVQRGTDGVAGVTVEMCTFPRSVFMRGDTPCTYSRHRRTTKTGADGVFRFEDVPIERYRFALLLPDKKWTITGQPCCAGLRKGGVATVGPFTLR